MRWPGKSWFLLTWVLALEIGCSGAAPPSTTQSEPDAPTVRVTTCHLLWGPRAIQATLQVGGTSLQIYGSERVSTGGLVEGTFVDGSTEGMGALLRAEEAGGEPVLTVNVPGEIPQALRLTQPHFVAAGSAEVSAPTLDSLVGRTIEVAGATIEIGRVIEREGVMVLVLLMRDYTVAEGWRVVGVDGATIDVGEARFKAMSEEIPMTYLPKQRIAFMSASELPEGWQELPVKASFDGLVIAYPGTVEVPLPDTCSQPG